MYKSAQNVESYIKRTANHSTKPKKTGANEHLHNEKTRDALDYKLAAIKEASLAIADIEAKLILKKIEYQGLQDKLIEVKKKMEVTLPHTEYHRLNSRRGQIVRDYEIIRAELIALNSEKKKFNFGKYAGTWEMIFTNIARNVLPPDIFQDIASAAKDIHAQQKEQLQ